MSTVVAVVGPTAAGKSELAVALAQALGAEVVNADSMQLYRGMDIGTAKLPVAERGGVPHHLLDVWDVTKPASVAEYQRLARATIDRLVERAVPAVLVGGSGLYVRAVVDRLDFPGTDPELRARLEAELEATGPRAMHTRLAAADPGAALAILPTNGRRLVRALEVLALTARPIRVAMPPYESVYDVVQLGIDPPLDELDHRIETRVDAMFDGGLVTEVGALVGRGLREGVTARRALGYAQVLRHLDGELTEAQARSATAQATRRFVRRQRSWFRRDPRVIWLPAPDLALALRELRSPGRSG